MMAVTTMIGAPIWAIVIGTLVIILLIPLCVIAWKICVPGNLGKAKAFDEFKISVEWGHLAFIHSLRNRDVWYLVVERITFFNKDPQNPITIDASISLMDHIAPVGQPLEEWENLKLDDEVENQRHLAFPVTLSDAPIVGYLAFRLPIAHLELFFGFGGAVSSEVKLATLSIPLIVKILETGEIKQWEIYRGCLTFESEVPRTWEFSNAGYKRVQYIGRHGRLNGI